MSRNKKYIDQFDRNAGAPAGFDNLFSFEEGQLMTKKKIRAVNHKRKAFTMSASVAAVIAAAVFGISFLNEAGIPVSIGENASVEDTDITQEMMSEEALSSDENGYHKYSEFVSRFDYELTECYEPVADSLIFESEWTSDAYINADLVLRAVMIKKELSDDGTVVYMLHPEESIINLQSEYANEASDLSSSSAVTVSAPEASSDMPQAYVELQAGNEYILPLKFVSDNDEKYVIMDNNAFFPIRKTEYGWLVSETSGSLADNISPVEMDMDNFKLPYTVGLSDDPIMERVEQLLLESGYYISHIRNTENQYASEKNLSSFFDFSDNGPEYESVDYYVNDDGKTDKTTVVLENEKYFTLRPQIQMGKVIYSGENLNGDLTISIYRRSEVYTESPELIVFTGVETSLVNVGDIVYEYEPFIESGTTSEQDRAANENKTIATCSTDPVYCRFFDINGPVEVNIDVPNTDPTE